MSAYQQRHEHVSAIRIDQFADGVEPREPGLWVARNTSAVSYPAVGNSWCFSLEDSSFWFTHRNNCIIELLKRHPPNGFLLDVGGGNGFVSVALQTAGWQVVLIEPGIQGVVNARARGLSTVINSSFEEAGIKNGSVPAIGMFDVLEHIQDDAKFLKIVRAALKPEGKLYLSVPAYSLLWSKEDDFAGHHRRYSASGLSATLREAGFTVDFVTYMFSFLPLPIFFFRAIPSRIGLHKSSDLDTARKQHQRPQGWLGHLVEKPLFAEISLLRKGYRIPFGGSLLAAATPR
jgi:SAM-dependent methyltransferase